MIRRIAYVTTTYPCRSETFLRNEISLLNEKDLEIIVFAAKSDGSSEEIPGVEVVRNPGLFSSKSVLSVLRLLTCWPIASGRIFYHILRYIFNSPYEGLSLIKNFTLICYFVCLLRTLHVSHIHGAFLSWPGRIVYILSKATGLSYSLAVHARDGYVESGAVKLKAANAKFIMCCSNTMAKHIQSKVNINDYKKVYAIYHGVCIRSKKIENNTSDTIPAMVAMGRFVEKKGLGHLIAAFKEVSEEFPSTKLILIGDGPERENIRNKVQEYGLGNQVLFTGWQRHHEALVTLSKATMLIVPSIITSDNDRDGIPNVILEAFMLKVPVIASRLTTIQEAIIDGENGLLYEPGNILQLKEAITRILSDHQLTRRIIERAFGVYQQKFNAMKNIQKVHSMFCGVVK